MMRMHFVVLFVTTIVLVGCGESAGGPVVDSRLEGRCQLLCDVSTSPACTIDVQNTCLAHCRSRVSGVEFTCAVCMIDNGYGPYESMGVCQSSGYVRDISSADCEAFCIDANHPGDSSDIAARCVDLCDVGDGGACTEQEQSQCMTMCVLKTDGLSFGCAACLIDNGYGPYESLGICESSGYVRDISTADCTDFCSNG